MAIGAALGAGLLLSGGVLNPAVALALGLGRSPALWAAALGGVAFAALFDLLSVKQGEGERDEQAAERSAEQPTRPAPGGAPQPVAVSRPSTSVANASHSSQLGFDPARSSTSRSRAFRSTGASRASSGAARSSSTRARSRWSSVIGMLTLPFALIGSVWPLLPRLRHTGPDARRVPLAPPARPERLDWE